MRPSAAPLELPRHRRRWPRPVLASLLIHAVILGFGWTAWRHGVPVLAPAPMAVRLLEAPVAPPAGPVRADRRPIRQSRPISAPTPSLRQEHEAPRIERSEPTADATAPARPGESFIRPETIADAVREAARGTALTQQADERSGRIPLPDAQARLAAGVTSAATTDCLKGGEGGHRHQGAGLLAVPLLLFDAAIGKCRK